jgi:hypothetical protein
MARDFAAEPVPDEAKALGGPRGWPWPQMFSNHNQRRRPWQYPPVHLIKLLKRARQWRTSNTLGGTHPPLNPRFTLFPTARE